MNKNVWDQYGQWDIIADSHDFEYIKNMITGRGITWKPNYVSAQLSYIMQSHNYLNQKAIALDFGCGLGRNSSMLARYFPRVVGFDLPEMIENYKGFFEGEKGPYSAIYSDLDALLKDEDITIVYDSVVFQHIVDESYTRSILQPFLEKQVLSTIVTVKNSLVEESQMMAIVRQKGWRTIYSETETLSFDGMPHDVVVLVKP